MIAIEQLYSAVVTYFSERDEQELELLFEDAPANMRTGARIVIYSGDASGTLHTGITDEIRNSVDDESVFAQMNERWYAIITASDLTAPTDKGKQKRAVRLLHDRFCEAVYPLATIDSAAYLTKSTVGQRGAAIQVTGTMPSLLYSGPTDLERDGSEVFPWHALTHVHLGDDSEDIET